MKTLMTMPVSGKKRLALFALLSFLCGTLTSFAMAPYGFWPCLLIGLGGLYKLLSFSSGPKSAFLTGWTFGFGYFTAGLYWIGNALLVEGNPYVWAYPLAVGGLPFALAFFPALSCMVARRFFDLRTISGYFGFCVLTGVTEWARGTLFTGFPWNLYGFGFYRIDEINQVAALGGVYTLTLLSVFWTAIPGALWVFHAAGNLRNKKTYAVTAGIFVIFCMCFLYGSLRISGYQSAYADNARIRIVQPNIPQEDKWNPKKTAENFFTHIRLTYPEDQSTQTTYIVWPETAVTERLLSDPPAMEILKQALSSYAGKAYLITGILRHEEETRSYYNSVVMIDRNGTVSNIYDKKRLVPFGEYIPYQKWIPLTPIVQFTGFRKGQTPDNFTTQEGLTYSPLVCYEGIFPLADAAKPSDFIVVVTNDGWYGDSPGPYQHLTQARFRAIESGAPVIRSANTGISALIDPLGRITQQSALFTESSVIQKIPLPIVDKAILFYLRKTGFAVLCIVGVIVAVAFRKKTT